jgi:hypothetical protein
MTPTQYAKIKAIAEDEQLFNELWAGTLFDIIHKVVTARPDWDDGEHIALIYRVIEKLAEEYGVIDIKEDDEP